jgi:ketosteroid isomerase-like protein
MNIKTLAVIFGFAVATTPVFAAEMDTSMCPNAKAWQDAFNRGDADGVINLYTSDAIETTPTGIRVGQAAVRERVKDILKAGLKGQSNSVTKCFTDGNLRWSVGEWGVETPQGHGSGFWTSIEAKQGNTWKIANLTWNVTPPPEPTNKQQ